MTDAQKLAEKYISELGIRHKSVKDLFYMKNWLLIHEGLSGSISPCGNFRLETHFGKGRVGIYSTNLNIINSVSSYSDRVNEFHVVVSNAIKANPFLDTNLYQLLYRGDE